MNKEFEEYIKALKEVEKENDNFELTLSKSEVLFIVKNFEQLENIKKEAIDFVNENIREDYYEKLDEYITHFIWNKEKNDLLNILNKGSDKDGTTL